ncbi:hypothetical protein D3C86_2119650 [compost metagenome]
MRITNYLNEQACCSNINNRSAEGFNYTHNFRTLSRVGFDFDQCQFAGNHRLRAKIHDLDDINQLVKLLLNLF